MTSAELKERFPFRKNESGMSDVLLCFHHAGGSAMVFRNWIRHKLGFELIPVEIPGRGTRCREACMTDFKALVKDLSDSIKSAYDGRKVYMFGHSLGSIIAFEVANRLEDSGINVEKLFVAGREAPHCFGTSEYRCEMGTEGLKNELLRIGATPKEVLEDEDFNEYMLPVIYSDYKLGEDYEYDNSCADYPIVALSGKGDPEADYEMMDEWKKVTNSDFRHYSFEGDHFFPYGAEEEQLLGILNKEIGEM